MDALYDKIEGGKGIYGSKAQQNYEMKFKASGKKNGKTKPKSKKKFWDTLSNPKKKKVLKKRKSTHSTTTTCSTDSYLVKAHCRKKPKKK
tara:strand:+ start:940 stop:1209 length:270 start_codon:yes stop_codon:yes gene_type:complete